MPIEKELATKTVDITANPTENSTAFLVLTLVPLLILFIRMMNIGNIMAIGIIADNSVEGLAAINTRIL
jgi:hypothetical protein